MENFIQLIEKNNFDKKTQLCLCLMNSLFYSQQLPVKHFMANTW